MNAFVFVPRHSKQNQCLWNYKAACQPQQYWVSVVLFPDIFVQKIDKTGGGNSCCLKYEALTMAWGTFTLTWTLQFLLIILVL